MNSHSHEAWHSSSYTHCPKCGGTLSEKTLKAGEPTRLVCTRCSFIFFQDPKVATGCIIKANDRLVLVKRSIKPGYGKWVFPGGYVDLGEPVQAAAIRETLEESCLQVEIDDLLGVYSYAHRPVVVIVWTARVTGGELKAADECSEAALFLPTEIPWNELAFSSTVDALIDYVGKHHGLSPPKDLIRPG